MGVLLSALTIYDEAIHATSLGNLFVEQNTAKPEAPPRARRALDIRAGFALK
jgi:hypothetical protein